MGALNPFLSLLPIPRTELRFTQWSKGPRMLLLLHMDSCLAEDLAGELAAGGQTGRNFESVCRNPYAEGAAYGGLWTTE